MSDLIHIISFFTGFQEGCPIKIITDSIGKQLPRIKNSVHELKTGYNIPRLVDEIYAGKIRIGGLRVIFIHAGTNGIDYRVWGGRLTWDQRLKEMEQEVVQLHKAIRTFNGSAFIIFSSVLPRPCDWNHTGQLVVAFNQYLKVFSRRHKCGYAPFYTSYVHKKDEKSRDPVTGRERVVVKRGTPLRHFFAIRDKGLHLNLSGGYIFTSRVRALLETRELQIMVRRAGFEG